MPSCQICGSRFAENKCSYCDRSVCSSCMVDEGLKCVKCVNRNSVPLKQFIKRNKFLIISIGAIWVYTVYPFPFLVALGFNVDISAVQAVLIATVVLTIPFLFLLKAWQKRPPR